MHSAYPNDDIRTQSFAAAVGQLVRKRATGLLELHDVIGANRAFFLDGVPQGAKLTRLKNPVGRMLVEEGLVTEQALNEALLVHNRTEQLLGQVLIDMKVIDTAGLQKAMARQSRMNLLSLFGCREGRLEFHEGLVHLTDFVPAPIAPVLALYEGVRDYAREETTHPLLARVAFAAVTLTAGAAQHLAALPAAEQAAAGFLSEPRLPGELARAVALAPKALAALLFTLNELEALQIVPLR